MYSIATQVYNNYYTWYPNYLSSGYYVIVISNTYHIGTSDSFYVSNSDYTPSSVTFNPWWSILIIASVLTIISIVIRQVRRRNVQSVAYRPLLVNTGPQQPQYVQQPPQYVQQIPVFATYANPASAPVASAPPPPYSTVRPVQGSSTVYGLPPEYQN